jgi:hypothetical protein
MYFFYGEGLLAPRPTPKLEDHPSSAVRGCLFNLFTATLHIGGRSSIRNLRTRHAVVTGTHIHGFYYYYYYYYCYLYSVHWRYCRLIMPTKCTYSWWTFIYLVLSQNILSCMFRLKKAIFRVTDIKWFLVFGVWGSTVQSTACCSLQSLAEYRIHGLHLYQDWRRSTKKRLNENARQNNRNVRLQNNEYFY